jgi:1,4-dihydroxy-2-naphthoate octaprenyltransferase
LPAAVAPVLAATGVAAWFHLEVWWKAVLALLVSLLLQVGVNYANDYSDGVRGTDEGRVGPMRLVGSGAATPRAVKHAALGTFAAAAVVGLVLAATTAWWLVALGAVSILAAWFYTGGTKPYGYLGLGEVMVFVFFGLVAVLGTVFVQVHHHSGYDDHSASPWPPALFAAVGVGALACAILVANNLRDIPTDAGTGKHTLAVRLGDQRTRYLYAFLIALAVIALLGVAGTTSWWSLLGLVALVPLGRATRTVLTGARGMALVPVLAGTGLGELLWAVGLFVGLLAAR